MPHTKANLVLIPGLLCTPDLWRAQVDGLSDIANVKVADHTRADSIAEIARMILEEAPPRFALGGLSMGGYVCFEIWRQAPDRVEKLLLSDTSPHADSLEQITRRKDFMALARRGKFKGITPQLLPTLLHKDSLKNEALKSTILRMAAEVGIDGFLRQEQAIIDRPDSMADLEYINCPTLVMCGAGDTLTPVSLHHIMVNAMSNAKLCIIDGAGHLPPLEQPEKVTGAMREWLQVSQGQDPLM